MNYTEEYCTELLQKVINDLDARYGGETFYDKETPFEAFFENNVKNLYDNSMIKNCWLTRATVPRVMNQGCRGGSIIISIDDDTGKALTYVNHALGGRPITHPLRIDKDGKYYIYR